jgi:hypothetical protein
MIIKPFIMLIIWLLVPILSLGSENHTVKHYQSQDRYVLGIKILELALSKLDTDYEIQATEEEINEARGEAQVIDGLLDVEFMITTEDREKNMIPIKIPIYRGTLGLRLLLVKKERQKELQNITNIKQLQKYTGGHGKHWSDLAIYGHNNLPVITNVLYENLFKQLISNRFDYFHRGILEIWQEKQQHSEHLTVADNIMLFYPQPTYFFVSKQRPKLALAIEKGLKQAIKDGSFKQLFLAHVGDDLKQAKLTTRKLIILDNPILPINTPLIDMSWWLPKKFQNQIKHSQ